MARRILAIFAGAHKGGLGAAVNNPLTQSSAEQKIRSAPSIIIVQVSFNFYSCIRPTKIGRERITAIAGEAKSGCSRGSGWCR
jgi:hypothetical protein